MPARKRTITCKNCGVRITLTRAAPRKKRAKRKKPKSAARVARGKFLAANLPRDESGKFLKFGEVNRFVPKRRGQRRSRGVSTVSIPSIKRFQEFDPEVLPSAESSRFRFGGVSDFFPSAAIAGNLVLEAAARASRAAIEKAARGAIGLPP